MRPPVRHNRTLMGVAVATFITMVVVMKVVTLVPAVAVAGATDPQGGRLAGHGTS
jgi:hypothetical protein